MPSRPKKRSNAALSPFKDFFQKLNSVDKKLSFDEFRDHVAASNLTSEQKKSVYMLVERRIAQKNSSKYHGFGGITANEFRKILNKKVNYPESQRIEALRMYVKNRISVMGLVGEEKAIEELYPPTGLNKSDIKLIYLLLEDPDLKAIFHITRMPKEKIKEIAKHVGIKLKE